MKLAIVDDDPKTLEEMKSFALRYGEEREIAVSVTPFTDGIDLIDGYRAVWDALILDIQMKHLDGMETARQIRALDPVTPILFTTSLARYAIQSYEVAALDYILKPVTYEKLRERLDRIDQMMRRAGRSVVLTTSDGKVRVALDDVLYFEVQGHQMHVVTTKGVRTLRMSLSEMAKKLEEDGFALCNQCYLVNLKNVTEVRRDTVLVGTQELPVSRPRRKAFLEAFTNYLGEEL